MPGVDLGLDFRREGCRQAALGHVLDPGARESTGLPELDRAVVGAAHERRPVRAHGIAERMRFGGPRGLETNAVARGL